MVSVPLLAGRASANPFWRFGTAILTDKYGFGFCHDNFFTPLPLGIIDFYIVTMLILIAHLQA